MLISGKMELKMLISGKIELKMLISGKMELNDLNLNMLMLCNNMWNITEF